MPDGPCDISFEVWFMVKAISVTKGQNQLMVTPSGRLKSDFVIQNYYNE